ncbi:MAG: zinc ABC transporter substrate-binding protein [Nitrospinae bacterium]|nr:zinc ABC transporter substrate-binding protein [Nitrospinota bacterium]
MKNLLTVGFLAIVLTAHHAAPASAAPRVVTSIKPLHSLVSGVMKGIGEPYLLIKGVASPHTFSLKPSDARELERARVIFWVGDVLAPGLERPLEILPKRANVVALGELKGLELLKLREGGLWEGHDDDHGGEKKAEGDHHDEGKEAKDGDDDHDKEKRGKAEDDHHDEKEKTGAKDDDHEKMEAKAKDDDHHEKAEAKGDHGDEEDHGGFDAHIWLDPMNARKWVDAIAHELEEVDPPNKNKYEANARNMKARIDALDKELAQALAPVKGAPYIVFHDAYQYMEKRYGLTPIGSVTLSPEKKPGSARLVAIRRKIRDTKSICVFTEPQFQPRLVKVIMEGTGAGTGVLDPLGTGVPAGEDAYFTLMRNMAKSLGTCLSGK